MDTSTTGTPGGIPARGFPMDTSRVTRFEVIDHTDGDFVFYASGPGRSVVGNGVTVELSLQDEGRTLKVFLTNPDSPPSGR